MNCHKRNIGKKSKRDDLYEKLPVEDVYIDAEGNECICPDCNAEMTHLGYEFLREELRTYPRRMVRVRIQLEKPVCPACKEEVDTTITTVSAPETAVKTQFSLCFHSSQCHV